MKKPKRRNEAALKRKGERKNARAKNRAGRIESILRLPKEAYEKREKGVRARMARKIEV